MTCLCSVDDQCMHVPCSHSPATVSAHNGLQVDDATRYCDTRHGRSMGFFIVVVFPQLVWPEWSLPPDSGFRQRCARRELSPCQFDPQLTYFLCGTFFCNQLQQILLAADSSQSMTSGGPMAAMVGGAGAGGAPAPGAPVDYAKLFTSEKDNLEFAEGQYKWVGQDVERRVLERWGKIPTSAASTL